MCVHYKDITLIELIRPLSGALLIPGALFKQSNRGPLDDVIY